MSPTIVVLLAVATVNARDLPPGAVLRLGDTRFRAGGPVAALQFSPDGTALSAWVTDGPSHARQIAWDAVTGVRAALALNRLAARPDPAMVARFGSNLVLTAGPGNAAHVTDAEGRLVAKLSGHAGTVTAVAVSPDGKRLATGTATGVVRTWDAVSLRPISEAHGHTATIRTIRVSADGKRAATTSYDGTARVWDLKSGKELRAFPCVGLAELTRDGLGLILREGETILVRDVLTGLEVVPESPPACPVPTVGEAFSAFGLCLVASPDGRTMAFSHSTGITVLEAVTHGLRWTMPLPGSRCRVMAFTPDGLKLLTSGADHTVLVWDVRPQAVTLPDAVRRTTDAGKLWATMCAGKSDASYLAMARLSAEPAAAVQTARLRMKPATAPDAATLNRLLRGLGDDDFATREAAEKELDAFGEPTAVLVKARLAKLDSAEARRRAEGFVARWTGGPAVRLADARAIELLSSLDTKGAWDFLKELAAGDPTAWRTQTARRALNHLQNTGTMPK